MGIGDYNHDGRPDIRWQNSSGEVDIWELNGTSVIDGGGIANPARPGTSDPCSAKQLQRRYAQGPLPNFDLTDRGLLRPRLLIQTGRRVLCARPVAGGVHVRGELAARAGPGEGPFAVQDLRTRTIEPDYVVREALSV
jgi:hypothetical protein